MTQDPLGERTGDRIGHYELVEPIGEGGMGTVWRAKQHEPIRRDVALKIIKLGMDTREVVARFEAERQALALMDHPHIAKVFDAGATESGRPFFVMELVDGTPITAFCDANQTDLGGRLELLRDVCLALQHAHQKGIIHRDIKPSNVLVALQDGKPAPKVIDFGIAKATDAELTQKTLMTESAQIIGTPEYMAPEQAAMSGMDIDTRADVYSLGVVLYELLTGTKPFDVKQALELGFQELLRKIREDDPPRPSTRISTLGAMTTEIAAQRHVAADALSRRLRGDLDWIVMKALEKDRARRYATAAAFAEDLDRYLNDEAVSAVPPSAAYRLSKLLRRRKKTVLAAAVMVFLLVAGSIGTGLGWWQASELNARLETALDEKSDALEAERIAKQQAVANAERANEEAEFARIARADADDRLAEMRRVASFQRDRLGQVDPGRMGIRLRRSLEEAVDDDDRATLDTTLTDVNFTSIARRSLAENLFDPTLQSIEREFHDQPILQAELLQAHAAALVEAGFGEAALDPAERALAIQREHLAPTQPQLLNTITIMSQLLSSMDRFDDAERLAREAVEKTPIAFGADHPNVWTSLNNLGQICQARGDLEQAEKLFRETIEGRRRALGDDFPPIADALHNLAFVLALRGEHEAAIAAYDDAWERMQASHDPDGLPTLTLESNFGHLLLSHGQRERGIEMLQRSYAGFRRTFGDEHPRTVETAARLAGIAEVVDAPADPEPTDRDSVGALEAASRAAAESGKRTKATELLRRALDRSIEDHGRASETTLALMNRLGVLLLERGDLPAAEETLRELVPLCDDSLGTDHRLTTLARNNLGGVLEKQGDYAGALPVFLASYESFARVFGEDDPNTLSAQANAAQALCRLGRFEEAMPHLRQSYAGKRKLIGDKHPETITARDRLMWGLSATKQWTELEPHAREVLEISRRTNGDVHPKTITALQRIGAALVGQGRLAEAEPFMRECAASAAQYLGEHHEYGMARMFRHSSVLKALGRWEEAEASCREQVRRRKLISPPGHKWVVGVVANLAQPLWKQGKFAEAEACLTEALAGAPGAFGAGSETVLVIALDLADLYHRMDRTDDGRAVMQRLLDDARAADPADDLRLARTLATFGLHLVRAGQFASAEPLLRESLELRDGLTEEAAWPAVFVRSTLGAALTGQGEFDEGEPLLVESAEWLLTDPSMTPAVELVAEDDWAEEAAERVAAYYASRHAAEPDAGYAAKAEAWRTRIAARQATKRRD